MGGPASKGAEKILADCVDDRIGFRIRLVPLSNTYAVLSSIQRDEVHFAFLPSLKALQAESVSKARLHFRTEMSESGGEVSALLVRPDFTPEAHSSLKAAYSQPDSDLGFVVPRHQLSRMKISVASTVFAGSYEGALALLLQRKVDVTALPLEIVKARLGSSKPETGLRSPEGWKILSLTPSLPAMMFLSGGGLSESLRNKFERGFGSCFANTSVKSALKELVGSELFRPIEAQDLASIRVVSDVQERHPRILSLQND